MKYAFTKVIHYVWKVDYNVYKSFFNSCVKQTPPNLKYPLNLVLLELPVHSFDLFTRVFNATSGKRTPFDFKNG